MNIQNYNNRDILSGNRFTHIDQPIAISPTGGTVTWADMIDFGNVTFDYTDKQISGSWYSVLELIQSLITRINELENSTPTPVTQYTVTYNSNGSTSTPPASQTVNAGSSVTLASAINRNADSNYTYTFAGWNTSSDGTGTNYNAGASYTPTGNVTLYAKWNRTQIPVTQYTVTYNSNGGNSTPSSQQVNAGSSVTLASAINRNADSNYTYTFAGWNTSSDGTGTNYNAGASYTPTGNVTLYAKWNRTQIPVTQYTVTYNSNGGNSTPSSQQVNAGSSVTLASAINRNADSNYTYTFAGWNTSSDGTGTNYNAGASYTPTGNVTLYAKWNRTTIQQTQYYYYAGWTLPTAANVDTIIAETYPESSGSSTQHIAGKKTTSKSSFSLATVNLYYSVAKANYYVLVPTGHAIYDTVFGQQMGSDSFTSEGTITVGNQIHTIYKSVGTTRNITSIEIK